jgi:hypothetical protein
MKTRILLALIVLCATFLAPSTTLAAGSTTCGLTTPCCYELETAWGAGTLYVPSVESNWATYTPYTGAGWVVLYAGQYMNAGKVIFSDPDSNGMVTITIRLNPGFRFFIHGQNGDEASVHIQDYMDIPPHENPAPGQFTYQFIQTGYVFTTQLPLANYYGVHVSLIHNVPCTPQVDGAAPTLR